MANTGMIVSFGEMLIDFVPTESGVSLAEAPGFLKAPGGAPANVAIAITRLGGKAAFVGKLGDDEFGHMLAGILKQNKVSAEGITFDKGARTALAFVTLRADGEREFMFYRNPSADMLLKPEELNLNLIKTAKIFHYGSISLIVEPCRSAHMKAMEEAKKAGALLSYDPNLRLPLWPSAEYAKEQILSIWNQADLIKVSDNELEFLTGSNKIDDATAMSLWHPNLKLLLVTLGDKGCRYYTKVRWEFPRLEMQSGKYKLLLAGKENVREVVWKRLKARGEGADPQQLMNFTCFRDYLRYPNKVIRSNKLIHYLIAREAAGDPDPDPTAIFFRVNDKIVRFGRTEFALVTGLKFGACPPGFDPYAVFEFSPQSIYAKFFERKAVTADDLWAFFTDDSNFKQMSPVECLRLGQVVIAVHTVLGLESSNKVPEWVWDLVEQQPVWNAFPWGSVSFQVLLKNLKSVKYSIPLKSYHLNGNVLAFLGWIYEAFPEMGKSIGGRIAEKEGHRPRGVRYAYSKADSYGKILTEEVPTSLAADPDELNEPYMTTLEPPGTPFTFQYDPSRVSLARAARAPRAKRGRGTSDEGNEEEAEAQVQAAEEAEVPTESRGGKRAKAKDLVAREVRKVKEELKQELMGSFAEHVAGLVFEKLKTFNFNQSGHVEAGGSSGRGEGNDELVDVEDEEREGDAAADEDEEEEEAEEDDVEGSRGAVSVGQQTAVGSTVEGSRGAAYVGPKTRFRSRFHLVNEPIDADAPLTETDREQLQQFERDMTEAPLPNLILDAAPTEPRPLPNPFLDAAPSQPRPLLNPFLDPLPIEPEAAQDAPSADVGVEAEAAPTALQTYRRTLRPRKPARALKSPYLRK